MANIPSLDDIPDWVVTYGEDPMVTVIRGKPYKVLERRLSEVEGWPCFTIRTESGNTPLLYWGRHSYCAGGRWQAAEPSFASTRFKPTRRKLEWPT